MGPQPHYLAAHLFIETVRLLYCGQRLSWALMLWRAFVAGDWGWPAASCSGSFTACEVSSWRGGGRWWGYECWGVVWSMHPFSLCPAVGTNLLLLRDSVLHVCC